MNTQVDERTGQWFLVWVLWRLSLNKDSAFGRIATAVATALLAPLGFYLTWSHDFHRQHAWDAFRRGDFIVVVASEDDDVVIAEAQQRWGRDADRARAVASAPDHLGGGLREVLAVSRRPQPHCPRAEFLERLPATDSLPVRYYPRYAAFKGPDAVGKLRRWGQENGYAGTDFPLAVLEGETTAPARLEKPGSTVVLTAYFEAKGRLYRWDGARIVDLSGDVGGQSAHRAQAEMWASLAR